MYTIRFLRLFTIVSCLFGSGALLAQPDISEKGKAVDRYMKAVPMDRLLQDSFLEMAKQLPLEKRAKFISDMRALVRADKLEAAARQSMLKTFSTEELNALADFYSSQHGASAMRKFGIYMADIMPPLMQELQWATQQLQAQQNASSAK